MTMKWIRPVALLLAFAGASSCHDPNSAAPPIEDEDRGMDVWEGTPWRALFLQTVGLGGRAELLGMVAGTELEVRAAAQHPWSVFTTPACSVAADPSAGGAHNFLKCVDWERADRSHRHPLDEYFHYEVPESRPRHLLTFAAETGMWHLWTIFWNGCGNCHDEAREAGVTQRR